MKPPNRRREHYLENRARLLERSREYYQANRVSIKARSLEFRKNNPERIKAKSRRYYNKNRLRLFQDVYRWRKRDRNKSRAQASALRRKRSRNLTDGYVRRILRDSHGIQNPTPEQITHHRTVIAVHRFRKDVKLTNTALSLMLTKTAPAAAPKIDSQIAMFAQLVQAGISAWEDAGRVLVAMRELDEDCFSKIRSAHPEISLEMLIVFDRIGRKQIYTPLLADHSAGARRLLEMPYEIQQKYCREPIDVAVSWKNGVVKSAKKKLCELSRTEVKMVFGEGEIHTLDQQAWRLGEANHAPKAAPVIGNGKPKATEFGYFSLVRDKAGNIKLDPCGSSPTAQTIRLFPAKDGWKSAVVFLYQSG